MCRRVKSRTPKLTLALLATVGSIAYGLLVTRAQPPPLPGVPGDHFLCYRVRDVTVPPFAPVPGVSLSDQFESGSFDVKKPLALCAPANKRGEGIVDEVTHLKSYRLRPHIKHVRQRNVRVVNQFGEVFVDTVNSDRLLVPTAKNLTTAPPEPGPTNVDHYKCYKVAISKGRPKFQPLSQVAVADQFESRLFDLKKPTHLCTPVSTNGGAIKNPAGHLLCYQASLSRTEPKQPPHAPVRSINVNNQFGPERLDTVKEEELCVPSLKNPQATTTSSTTTSTTMPRCRDGVVNQASEECDPPDDAACPGQCLPDCTCPLGLTAFEPMSGPAGTIVKITGTRLQTTTDVAFNGMSSAFSVLSDRQITATVPEGATSGPIRVTTALGTVTTAAVFAVLPRPDFSLGVNPGTGRVIQGNSTSYAVTLTSTNGFLQLASLSVSGLAAGLTATITPPQITAGQSAVLKVNAPAGQPTGTSTFTVLASATVLGKSVSGSATPALNVEPLTTSFLGRTVVDDTMQTSLAGVSITFLGVDGNGNPTGCSGHTVSDAAGNFALTDLPVSCVGPQLVRYDGTTATAPPGQYAGVDLVYTIVANQAVVAPALIHLPRIDDRETVMVRQNAPMDQTFGFKSVPFLSVTVYAGTIFTLADGTQPDPFPLVAVQVPVDRLPDVKPPNPSMLMVFIVAFQPANASASQPVAVTFPNLIGTEPATNMVLMTLDPTKGTMVPYGTGTVSNDGTQIVPDADPSHPGRRYGLVHFDWHGPMPPPANATNPGPNYCPLARVGRSVDLSSGLEVRTSTDITINGLRGPVSVVRTYRTLSNIAGPFGIGTNHNYGYQLNIVPFQQGQGVIGLVMPDGNQFPLNAQPDGTFISSTIPALRGAVLSLTPSGTYRLRWKDGTVFEFQTLGRVTVLTSITDPNGNLTILVRGSQPVQIAQVIDPVGRSLTLNYDGGNRIASIVDPIGRTVQYTYNAQGTLATVTDAAGGVTRYDYDGQNRLAQVTDPRGVVATRYAYDQNGRVAQETLADGGVTAFAYVLLNPTAPTVSPVLRTTVTDALGNQTVYHFNPQGFLLDVTDASGQTRIFEREAGTNLLLAVHGVAACPVCGGQAPGDQTFTYDDNGNVLSRTDALGKTTTFTYEPNFNKAASITDPLGHVTSFSYDSRGNLVATTDPSGQTTTFGYDATGLLTSVTDALDGLRTLTYDGGGNLVAVADPLGKASALGYDAVSRLMAATDPRGKTTHFAYDGLGRTTAVVDPASGTTQFAYDATGNLLSVTDALGHATTYAYDGKSRLVRRTDPLGAFESFEYDLDDNLTRHFDRKNQASAFAYDALNRRVSAGYADGAVVGFTYDVRGRLAQATDSIGGQVVRAYDPLDRLTIEGIDTGAVSYAYDELGRRTSMTVAGQAPVTYAYDASSRLTGIAQGAQAVDFTYDALGRRTRLLLPNGLSTHYAYDAASRITELTYRNAAGVLGNLTYEYDAAGNRTGVGGSFARTLLPGSISSASYDAANRQLQFGTKTMTFDANGNLTTSTDPTSLTTFAWDARDRLSTIVGPSTTAAFTYDVFGRRTGKQINGRLTSYLYDTADVIQELAAGMVIGVLRSLRIDEPLVRNGTEHYLAGPLGSTIALTDPAGAPQVVYTYEPFGRTGTNGPSTNPFQYAGRESDETGLYYLRARYYDPTGGRFLEEDPLALAGGDVNLYQYVSSNPVKLVDPFGLEGIETEIRREQMGKLVRVGVNSIERLAKALIKSIAQGRPIQPVGALLKTLATCEARVNPTGTLIEAAQAAGPVAVAAGQAGARRVQNDLASEDVFGNAERIQEIEEAKAAGHPLSPFFEKQGGN